MSATHLNEANSNEEYVPSREETRQRYPSTNSSTLNSLGTGEKSFQFNNPNERSGQNSRTSSLAESTTASSTSTNNEGFSNIGDIIQHLQAAWFDHNNHDGPRRTGSTSTSNTNVNEPAPVYYSKGHSQQHYTHHQFGPQHNQYSGQQHWNNYNNPRRSGAGGNYNRNYSGGNNDHHWNSKSNRFPSHRSMNNLMSNAVNYQQQSQSSPPTQRRQGDQQQYYHNEQSYHKKNRPDHDRRQNGYTTQQSSDSTSEQSNINSTQSYPSSLNSYNR